jgi:uncharacterized membrane protein YozB (DUF420 family)
MPVRSSVRVAAWTATLLGVVVLLVFSAIRIGDMFATPPPIGTFDSRYARHPWLTLLHMLPGLVYITLAPVQLMKGVRDRHPAVHRALGRVLVPCAVLSVVFGIVAAFRLPAFGGLPTVAATLFFGTLFLFSLARAIWHIRRWEVEQHREWMLRAFALGIGVATIRFFIGSLELAGFSFEQAFGTAFWLGFSTNMVAMEVWINVTRTASRPV